MKDGVVGLAQAQPEWREYVSWLNKMWEEGLIDQDILTEDDTTIKDKIHNDKCGISYTSMGQLNNWNLEREAAGKEAVWVGIPNPTADDGSIPPFLAALALERRQRLLLKPQMKKR